MKFLKRVLGKPLPSESQLPMTDLDLLKSKNQKAIQISLQHHCKKIKCGKSTTKGPSSKGGETLIYQGLTPFFYFKCQIQDIL